MSLLEATGLVVVVDFAAVDIVVVVVNVVVVAMFVVTNHSIFSRGQ